MMDEEEFADNVNVKCIYHTIFITVVQFSIAYDYSFNFQGFSNAFKDLKNDIRIKFF